MHLACNLQNRTTWAPRENHKPCGAQRRDLNVSTLLRMTPPHTQNNKKKWNEPLEHDFLITTLKIGSFRHQACKVRIRVANPPSVRQPYRSRDMKENKRSFRLNKLNQLHTMLHTKISVYVKKVSINKDRQTHIIYIYIIHTYSVYNICIYITQSILCTIYYIVYILWLYDILYISAHISIYNYLVTYYLCII